MTAGQSLPGRGRGTLKAIRTTSEGRELVTDEFSAHTPYGVWVTKTGRRILFDRGYHPLWQMIDGVVTRAFYGEWVIDKAFEAIFFEDGIKPAKRVELVEAILLGWGIRNWQSALFTACDDAPRHVRPCAAPEEPEELRVIEFRTAASPLMERVYATAGWEPRS